MAPKVITNEDYARNGVILEKEGFLRQHNHSEAAKKIIKDYENAKLMKLVTYDHWRIHKKEVIDFYLNVTVSGDGSSKSKVNEVEVIIFTEDIQEEFEMEKASNWMFPLTHLTRINSGMRLKRIKKPR